MIKNKKLILFGNSLMAEIAFYYFKNFTNYDLKYFVSEKKYIKNKKIFNIEVISLEDFLKKKDRSFNVFIARGYSKLNNL